MTSALITYSVLLYLNNWTLFYKTPWVRHGVQDYKITVLLLRDNLNENYGGASFHVKKIKCWVEHRFMVEWRLILSSAVLTS